MLSLGLSCFYHDSAIALVDDKEILFAAQEERFSRIKGDSSFPSLALSGMLKQCQISLEEISHVTYYEDPALKRERIAKTFVANFPSNYAQLANFARNFESERYFPTRSIEKMFGKSITSYFHHESHAASTFFPSPFDSSAVLVVDGVGEWATASIFLANREKPFLRLIEEERFPDSLGLFYATMTSFAGFKVNSGEYKFMGLAPYGKPRYVSLLKEKLIKFDEAGRIELNMEYFGYTKKLTMWSRKLSQLLGVEPRLPESHIRPFDCDLAKSTQVLLQEIYVKKSLHALKITNQKNLCIAGGVALNCVANGKLAEFIPIQNLFVQPASGDAGGALGAALLRSANENVALRSPYFNMKGAFLGTSFTETEVEQALLESRLKFRKLQKAELETVVAQFLDKNFSVGWFSGRMEFGPRALGARSILASAKSPEMQSRLNIQIKKRESFRPFAPIVLKEYAHDWFNWPKNTESSFMLFTAEVNEKHRCNTNIQLDSDDKDIDLINIVNIPKSSIPAVTHVDMSARLQTVTHDNPIYGLLEKYFDLSGIPVLVNTSFNVRNEPIVQTPTDAIRCFMTTDIDILAIEGFLVQKDGQSESTIEFWKEKEFIGELD